MIENLFNPAIECTDPDNLQFCLKVSDDEFWYCEPNFYNEKLLPGSNTPELELFEKYKGYPKKLFEDARHSEDVKVLLNNSLFWLTGYIWMVDFTEDEKLKLLDDYGYWWGDFKEDGQRNQIICENYFEQNPMEFRNDI